MNKFVLLLLITVCAFSATTMFGQLKVTTSNNIGIGISSPSNSKATILNNSESTSLTLSNVSTSLNTKYGIQNSVIQAAGSTGVTYGLHTTIDPFGSGSSHGIWNSVNSEGTGKKYGIATRVTQTSGSNEKTTGITSTIKPDGTGEAIGIENYVNNTATILGDGEKTGIYNYVRQKSSSTEAATGFNNSVVPEGSGDATGITINISEDGTGKRKGISNRVQTTDQNTSVIQSIYSYNHLRGSGTAYGFYNYNKDYSTTTGDIYGIYNFLTKAGTGTRYGIYSNANGTGDYAGYFVGDVYINGSLTYTSDERLKTEIQDIPSGLEIITALQPKSYKLKDGPNGRIRDAGRTNYGFLAQDLAQVLPDLVKNVPVPGFPVETTVVKEREQIEFVENEDGELIEQVIIIQEEETELTESPGDVYQSVDYNEVIPFLVKAIQEQQAEIEELKAKIIELEKK